MNKPTDDMRLAILMSVVLFAALLSRYKSALLSLYYQHRILIAFLISTLIAAGFIWVKNYILKNTAKSRLEKSILRSEPNDDAIFAGNTKAGDRVDIKHTYRRMHTQVIGTTNAGKTESVIIPWAVDDMKRGRGLIIIDGKSDRSLLDKLYAYAVRYGRGKDIRILSLCSPEISHTFNPLAGGSPLEITERVFKALTFENEYYKDLQYEALLYSLLILDAAKIEPTPIKIVSLLRSTAQMKALALKSRNKRLVEWVIEFRRLSREDREQRTSGLLSKLQVFTVGQTALIFNQDSPHINLETALAQNHIIYCQLPVLKIPTLGKTTGKLILQALQGAIASRHLSSAGEPDFFSVYLDDFTEYLTEGFVSTLNKSRSANILVTFAHQALGDLAVLGDDIKNTILTNSNLKVFMRTNEPTSAEYFSEVIGTAQSQKTTQRQIAGVLGSTKTGEGSVRDVEEFKFHPNIFKQELGTGEGVIVIPHSVGSLPVRLKFRRLPDLAQPTIPDVPKQEPIDLPEVKETDKKKAPAASAPGLIDAALDDKKEAS